MQLFRLEVQSLADNRTVINSQSFEAGGIRVGFIRCLQRFFRLRAFFEAIICIVLALIPQIRQLAKRLALQD